MLFAPVLCGVSRAFSSGHKRRGTGHTGKEEQWLVTVKRYAGNKMFLFGLEYTNSPSKSLFFSSLLNALEAKLYLASPCHHLPLWWQRLLHSAKAEKPNQRLIAQMELRPCCSFSGRNSSKKCRVSSWKLPFKKMYILCRFMKVLLHEIINSVCVEWVYINGISVGTLHWRFGGGLPVVWCL